MWLKYIESIPAQFVTQLTPLHWLNERNSFLHFNLNDNVNVNGALPFCTLKQNSFASNGIFHNCDERFYLFRTRNCEWNADEYLAPVLPIQSDEITFLLRLCLTILGETAGCCDTVHHMLTRGRENNFEKTKINHIP